MIQANAPESAGCSVRIHLRIYNRHRYGLQRNLVFHGKKTAVSRILIAIQSILLLQANLTIAQEQTLEKPLPSTRHLNLPLISKDSIGGGIRSAMPKIDLPEYVITGNAAIDLPNAEKQPVPEDSQSTIPLSLLSPPLTRSDEIAQVAIGSKKEIGERIAPLLNGKMDAGVGTFFSPQAGLWFGQTLGDYCYSLDGQYSRTKGFASFTDRSGGSIGLDGSTQLKSYNPYFDGSEIHAGMTYKSDTYHWYGTRIPSLSRNRTDLTVSAGLKNWSRSPFVYDGVVGYESFEVSDSSKTVGETRVFLRGATRLMASTIPLHVKLDAQLGSVSTGNSSSGLAYIDVTVGSERYTWKALALDGSLNGYFAGGMDNQRILRLYPHLDVAYRLNDQHTLRVAYEPEIEPVTLSAKVFENRYLSSLSSIKHTDDQQDATLALESYWTAGTSTKLEARVQSIKDYPLYADSLSQGVWLLAYGGRTTIASFSGEVFAKLRSNDYFAAKLTATTSNNSKSGNAIPYVPVFEVGISYTNQIASRWTGVATLTLIHQRKDNVVNINTLPSILLIGLGCEYSFLRQAGVFFEIQNLLNEQYEYWRGYQENPFVLSAGFSLRW